MADQSSEQSPRVEGWRDDRYRWAALDPAGDERGTVFSTVYIKDELIIDPVAAEEAAAGAGFAVAAPETGRADPEAAVTTLAGILGWTVERRELEDRGEGEQSDPGRSRSYRLRLGVAPRQQPLLPGGVVAKSPDAWQVLRQARADGTSAGISLNHVMTTDALGADPFKMTPFKMTPFKMTPFKMTGGSTGMSTYASPGFGGRQPITYLGQVRPPTGADGDRPVVAVFDTGCGEHPWFPSDVLIKPVLSDGTPIGLDDAKTDPEAHPSLARPLEGWLDDAAGHGTFIAGIIRQQCPDAWILPVRVSDGEGIILENELIGALGRLLALMEDGQRVDVLNLSFSFFHETPDDPTSVSEIRRLLDDIRAKGCVVVCSAGNDATDRPTAPATLGGGDPTHVVVGALNPSSESVALFSNIGEWVTVYAPGVSVVSTLPTEFNGSVQAGSRDDLYGRRRETLDVDEFAGGFAVWSGTSFSAPVVAGRVAALIVSGQSGSAAAKKTVEEFRAQDRSRVS